jgi:nucleoside 2-deoxyribosyltransferase
LSESVELIWPDDALRPSSRDGILAEMGDGRRYFVSRSLLARDANLLRTHRVALTHHIMQNGGDEPVEINTYNFDAIVSHRLPSVKQKLDALLRALATRANFQVQKFTLFGGDGDREANSILRAAGLSGPHELTTLLQHLTSQGLVRYEPNSSNLKVHTTIPGLVYVESQDVPNVESRTGFVAMWFSPSIEAAYTIGIKPAIEANGFDAVRVDSREHNNKIDDEIVGQIRRARFVVADFSCGDDGARGGVYFEAGYALGLDIPVIWCVRQADLKRVHFDTRQFNHIVWETPEELCERLKNRIGGTIGQFKPRA